MLKQSFRQPLKTIDLGTQNLVSITVNGQSL